MNTQLKEQEPLPRINVMRLEYEDQTAAVYKKRFISCSNYIFILWFAAMVLEKTCDYLGYNGQAAALIPHMFQTWIGIYMVYAGTRWFWASLFGDKKIVKIIG